MARRRRRDSPQRVAHLSPAIQSFQILCKRAERRHRLVAPKDGRHGTHAERVAAEIFDGETKPVEIGCVVQQGLAPFG